ncbi:MAG: hypothetical protein QGH15_06895 [Kiritimatiellia bacterium]|jgi:hypothetical protein|nr:hypothetical protein [Kiritimatiellia bacterium]
MLASPVLLAEKESDTVSSGTETNLTYYQVFTNAAHWRWVEPITTEIFDKNNSKPSVTDPPISFEALLQFGEVAGVRIGMSMSEVISTWGRLCHIESPPEFVGRMFDMMPQPDGSPANIPTDWPPEVGSVITRPPADPRMVEVYGNGIIELLYPKIQDSDTAKGSVQQDE